MTLQRVLRVRFHPWFTKGDGVANGQSLGGELDVGEGLPSNDGREDVWPAGKVDGRDEHVASGPKNAVGFAQEGIKPMEVLDDMMNEN